MFKPCKFTCYDGYNLTAAAIKGEKTQRRVIAGWNTKKNGESVITPSTYEVGDELVLIQPYKDVPELAGKGLETEQGWKNKMFAKIENLPYKVRITNVRLERLHDISNEDALAEGVKTYHCDGMPNVYSFEGNKKLQMYATPREAFQVMCDGIFGLGVWRRNPDVYVYDFEVIHK